MVRNLTASGLEAYGTEMSRASLDLHCSDLVRIGRVKQATLDSIPFNNNQFDLVFSSEVLEHVPEHMVDAAVKELARVSRGEVLFACRTWRWYISRIITYLSLIVFGGVFPPANASMG